MNIRTLRSYAVRRTLFPPTTLKSALWRLGYVQADPIRSPARAQDLILRLRVRNYYAGDLEAKYPKLPIAEDFFINYGFATNTLIGLIHPRTGMPPLSHESAQHAEELLAFIRERGPVHPNEVEAAFGRGNVRNYWGGSSRAMTHLMDTLHYRGLLQVVRRDRGIRVYDLSDRACLPHPEPHSEDDADAKVDALIDILVNLYAPLPGQTLSYVVSRLRYAVPQFRTRLKAAFTRARTRLGHQQVDGVNWYWPADENPRYRSPEDRLRVLAPFDPLVWDRRRFEMFWGWPYRFEAYTPASKRKWAYYALPMLWRDEIIGWGSLTSKNGELSHQLGFVVGDRPNTRLFSRALEDELQSMKVFLRA